MLTPSDLLHLPYTSDLSESGSAYACRWLAHLGRCPAGLESGLLREESAQTAVELAMRRYLGQEAIPFDVINETPFRSPPRYSITLGGHRCELVSHPVSRNKQALQVSREPGVLLRAPALVSLEHFVAADPKPDDLYLFAFLVGETASGQTEIRAAVAAGERVDLIHPLPETWVRPAAWERLEALVLKSECETVMPVEIGGLNAGREFVTAQVELPCRQRVAVEQEFYSLAYVRTHRLPSARIGLHSPRCGAAYIIPPQAWRNVWISGREIILAGWLTHEGFRSKASVLNAGMLALQFTRTRTRSLLVPVAELNPLGGLFRRVRAWDAERRQATSS